MKATDLMIGNWVSAYGKKTQVVWTGNIQKVALRGLPYEVFDDEIQPIPLTEEILEKNGIKYYDETNTYYWCNRKGFLEIIQLEYASDGIWQVLCKGRLGQTNNSFGYVHQLQHAIYLCGLEKEIEL